MSVRLTFLVCAIACLPVWLDGQSSQGTSVQPSQDGAPVFRTGVESVRFDAFVTDRKGEPVAGLTADDFDVYEDERLQVVRQFSPVVLPPPSTRRTEPARVEQDVALNDDEQNRIYVIVLDRLSWFESGQATKIVKRFLGHHFADSDLAAVMTLDHPGSLQFTNNRALLMDQVQSFFRSNTPHAYALKPSRLRPPRLSTAFPAMESFERASVFGTIGKALGHISARRKSILYISRWLDFDPYDAIDTPTSSFSEDARAAMEPIMASNLTVYPIHPGVEGPLTLAPMRALAHVTGAIPIGADVDKGFRQMVRDNSIYYVLGYESSNPLRDGGYRRIKVRMKRKDLNVRARDGYFVEFPPDPNPDRLVDWSGRSLPPRKFEPRSDLPSGLAEAMASPVALTAVPMKVFAAPHKTASRAGAVTVVIEIPASGLDLDTRDGRLSGVVDVAVGATSGLRSLRSTQFTYEVGMEGAERERVMQRGLRLTSEVTLDPGEYRLHVAAGTRGGRTGKLLYDLTVPDFGDQLLMMSGVSLTSRSATDVPTLQTGSARALALSAPVAASREFQRSDVITVYAEVYENVWWTDSDHTVTFRTELRGDDGRVIPITSEGRSSTAALKPYGIPFVAELPLANVPPGSYLLRVEGRSSFGTSRSVMRELAIEVR